MQPWGAGVGLCIHDSPAPRTARPWGTAVCADLLTQAWEHIVAMISQGILPKGWAQIP